MQIRTQQHLIAVASLVIVAGLTVALLNTLHHGRLEVQRNQLASDIVAEGTSGLRVVTLEYVFHRHERPRRQWLARHERLGAMIQTRLFDGTPEQALLERLRGQHGELLFAFEALSAVNAETGPAAGDIDFQGQLHFVTRIMLITDEMVADTRRLLRVSQQKVVAVQQRIRGIAVGLALIVVLLIATNYLLLNRQVLEPVTRLNRGAEELGRGNLAFRTAVPWNNELGRLSRSFDTMAARHESVINDLEDTQAQLEAANHELETFSYSVSHDLRAPLRGIDGWSLALIEDYGPQLDARALSYLERVRSESQRMGQLIDDLLELSRTGRMEVRREPIDMSLLAEKIVDRLRRDLPGRDIEFSVQPGLQATGDPQLLEIMLTNLLANAAKFTGQNPSALVEVGARDTRLPGGGAVVHAFFVRDNGAGFDMAHAKRLFGPFQRMHSVSEFPGTGIGLATVERIIRRHGGRVWAEAAPDRGACFFFVLGKRDSANTPTFPQAMIEPPGALRHV